MFTDANLVKSLAWKFHRSTGLEFEELCSEGNLAFVIATKTYEDTKGTQFSTWAYHCIKNRLIDFCKRNPRYTQLAEDYDEAAKEYVASLDTPRTTVARAIREMVLGAPEIYSETSPCKAKTVLKKQLRTMGWTWKQLAIGFKELQDIYGGNRHA